VEVRGGKAAAAGVRFLLTAALYPGSPHPLPRGAPWAASSCPRGTTHTLGKAGVLFELNKLPPANP